MPVLPHSVTKCLTASYKGSSTNILLDKMGQTPMKERLFSTASVMKLEDDPCKAKEMKPCMPKCEIKKPPIPPCKTLKQQVWEGCDRICLPCCGVIHTPISCDTLDVKLNHCKKEEYRLPSYSECNKAYNNPRRKKECCYFAPVCHLGELRDREIKPLIRIKDRQAMALGKSKY